MAARRIIKGSAADVENGNDVKDSYDSAVSYGSGSTFTGRWSSPLIALGLLTLVATAAYYERNVLTGMAQLGPAEELRVLANRRREGQLARASSTLADSSAQLPSLNVPNVHSPSKQQALSYPLPRPDAAAVEDAQLLSGVASPPTRAAQQAIQLTNAASKLAVQQRLGSQSGNHGQPAATTPRSAQTAGSGALAVAAAGVGSAAKSDAVRGDGGADGGSLQGMSLDALTAIVVQRTQAVRAMKAAKKVFEVDAEAKAAAKALQEAVLVERKYGPEPYNLEIQLRFPESMPDYAEKGSTGKVLLEMAPTALMPYSVLTFLDMVTEEWKGGAFHRNAPHVKQATVKGKHPGFPLAFQEYSPDFPHKKYTLGFAGRPSSSAFYISTVDNTHNHGPGSQGSKTEADACFAKVVGAESKAGPSVDVVKRLDLQPGGQKPNGFVGKSTDHVVIESFKLLKHE